MIVPALKKVTNFKIQSILATSTAITLTSGVGVITATLMDDELADRPSIRWWRYSRVCYSVRSIAKRFSGSERRDSKTLL